MAAFVTRVVFASLLLVVAFAAVFAWVDAGPGWPDLPPHFAKDLDLAVGLGFCTVIAIWSLPQSQPESGELG